MYDEMNDEPTLVEQDFTVITDENDDMTLG